MVVVLLASLLTAESLSVSDLAHRFVVALERRDIVALHKLAAAGTNFDDPAWLSVNEFLDTADRIQITCEEIRFERQEGSTLTVRLHVEGTSVTAGAPRRSMSVPRLWQLQLQKEKDSWRIRSAMTAEQALASRIIAEPDNAARWAMLPGNEFDSKGLSLAIAWLATDGTHERAADAVQFAIDLTRENGDAVVEAECLRLLSVANVLAHDSRKALVYADRSLSVARHEQSLDAECAALFALGIAEWLSDDPLAGVEHLEEAGALVDRIDDPRTAIKSIYMAAHILLRQGDLSGALAHAERSQKLSERYRWRTGIVDALLMTGTIHDQLQNAEIYSQLSRRAYDEAVKIDDSARAAMAVYNQAEAETRLEHFDRAIGPLNRMIQLPISELLRTSALDLLGASLTKQRRYAEAESALAESLDISRKIDDRRLAQLTLAHLSDLRFAQGRYTDALSNAREAIDITASGEGATRTAGEFRPWVAWTARGRALEKLGRPEEAITAFRRAIDLIEQSRQSSPASELTSIHYFRGNAYPYLALIDLLIRKHAHQEALVLSMKIKGRTLHDAVEGGRVDLPSLMSSEERAHERELNRRIARLSRARMAASDAQRGALDDAIRRAQDTLQAFSETLYLARTRATTAADVSAPSPPSSLTRDALILNYVVTEESVIVFTIDETASHARRLPVKRSDLRLRIARFARAVEQRDLRWRADARQLYDLLLTPVEQHLRSKRVIGIIPDDVLWHVPFEALLAPDGAPLIERVAVFYSPSLSFLRAPVRARRRHSLLAVGDPSGTAERLPEAEEEVRSIAAVYQDASVFTGTRARETTIKSEAGKYDVLHFATHALIDDRSPMFSTLLLTADKENDGLLQARELLRLNLRADLAVLSACRTGRGAVYPGEGVVGLSWALLLAGCPTSVVSRWIVNSRSTADLMIAFHRELSGHDLTPAEALRRAALAMRSQPQYRHPYYWAAFQVVGIGW